MKYFSILLFLGALLLNINCATSKATGSYVKGEEYSQEGWLDENTFQVVAEGTYPRDKKIESQVQRRTMSKEAAILMAQKAVIEKFAGSIVKGSSSVVDGVSIKTEVEKIFSDAIRGGSIVKVTYSEDDDASIIYKVEAKGLKKKLDKMMK